MSTRFQLAPSAGAACCDNASGGRGLLRTKSLLRAAITLLALPLVGCPNPGLAPIGNGQTSPKPVGYVYATLLNVNAVLEINNLQSSVSPEPILVPGGPVALAIDPRSIQQYLYVVCSLGNSVAVVDRRNRLVNRTINVQANPQGIAVTPSGRNAFVTNQDSGTISVIDLSSNTVTQTISLGAAGSAVRPQGIAVSADGTRVYVACQSGQVAILQGTPGAANYSLLPLLTLPGAIAPQNIAIAPISGGNRVFITDPQSNNLFVFTDSGQPTQPQALQLPGGPTGVAVGTNPRTGQADGLFVTASQSNAMYSIDLQSLTPSPIQVEGSDPTSVMVSSQDDEVYVSLSGNNNVEVFKRVSTSALSRPQRYNLNQLDPKYISPTGGIALGGYLGGS